MRQIIEINRALFRRARELNARAGRDVFPVPSREELAEVLLQALGGATRLADINNPESLRLPELDVGVVADVLAKCPDTITVCGREAKVEYRLGNPSVQLDFSGDRSREWLKLPDDSVCLPDGREVYVAAEIGGYYISGKSPEFKAKARKCLNQGLWDNWQKPELPAPTDFVSPIVEAEYGRCVVTNVSLIGFGAVNHDSWYGSWKSYWSRDRVEIERIHAQAKDKFVEVREKVARDALKKRVGELYSTHSYNRELSEEIRTRLYNAYYGYLADSTTAEIEALIAKVEAEVEATTTRKAEAETRKCEAGARREAVDEALRCIDNVESHIWVTENSDVAYILAGKTSRVGNFEVTPAVSDAVPDSRPYCFGNPKYRRWVAFRLGVRSKAQDFSGRGNLQSEMTLFVPEGLLSAGVYGVGADEQGQFFFPVIHHKADGAEVIPEINAIRKIRMPKESSKPVSSGASVDLTKVDLSKLFGGGAKIRR